MWPRPPGRGSRRFRNICASSRLPPHSKPPPASPSCADPSGPLGSAARRRASRPSARPPSDATSWTRRIWAPRSTASRAAARLAASAPHPAAGDAPPAWTCATGPPGSAAPGHSSPRRASRARLCVEGLAEPEARVDQQPLAGDARGHAGGHAPARKPDLRHHVPVAGRHLHGARLTLHVHQADRDARVPGRLQGPRHPGRARR
jgi:hypothetical protein